MRTGVFSNRIVCVADVRRVQLEARDEARGRSPLPKYTSK